MLVIYQFLLGFLGEKLINDKMTNVILHLKWVRDLVTTPYRNEASKEKNEKNQSLVESVRRTNGHWNYMYYL